MTRHLLVVCTANVCRSPVAERLFQRALSERSDVDGESWVVRSAGTARVGAPTDINTIVAGRAVGLDMTDHVPRHLDRKILATDGFDLVLTMTRTHIRTIVALDRSAWKRTFTLKELARRSAEGAPPSAPDGGFPAWRERLATERRAADMLAADPSDDVADPYGAPLVEHRRMVGEVRAACERLLLSGLWGPRR